jgi:hypothetical protein
VREKKTAETIQPTESLAKRAALGFLIIVGDTEIPRQEIQKG